ncbi:MAG: serpin family protein, partial [Gemmatimonadota bacterium]
MHAGRTGRSRTRARTGSGSVRGGERRACGTGGRVGCARWAPGAQAALPARPARVEHGLRAGAVPAGERGDEQIHSAFHDLYARWNEESEDYELMIANQLLIERELPVEEAFLDVVTKQYGAGVEAIDFGGPANLRAAIARINSWARRRTNEHVRELVPPGGLDSYTQLAALNAVYFRGKWEEPFESRHTHPAPFHVDEQAVVTVPFMGKQLEAAYARSGEASLVELPFRGQELSMVFLLPATTRTLEKVVEGLEPTVLSTWLDRLEPRRVCLMIPRFDIAASRPIDLRPQLEALGMPVAFMPNKADFSGISGAVQLRLD